MSRCLAFRHRLAAGCLAGLLALVGMSAASPVRAQALTSAGGDGAQPLEVYAEDGIEWQQNDRAFIARGAARAVRGTLEVHASLLKALYREKPGGGTDVYRLEAHGDVRIVTPTETAYGDVGVYDIDKQVMVLSGGKVRLVTATHTISADRQLEYWEGKQMAVARGNALAAQEDKRLRADVLVAYFRAMKEGKNRIQRVEAFDNVHIVTQEDVVVADRGVYRVDTGIVTLSGQVNLTRGGNQINGCSAVVDLNTGISRLQSCKDGGGGRVKGLLQPDKVRGQ